MCVSSTRPLTSPIAYSQSLARIESSTSIGLPGSRPTDSRPISSVTGSRPTATSSSSARTGPPIESSTSTSPFDARTATAETPPRTSTPRSCRPSATSCEANGSSRAISRSAASISVTCDPSELHACAISTPTTPPPSTASRAGTNFAVVAWRLFHGSASRRPSIGGTAAPLPVQTTTACRATSTSSSTRTRRSPSSRPCPRTSAMPFDSSQGSMPESSRSWITWSRRASAASTSSPSATRPGMRRTSASSSPGRSSAFDGMQA